MTRRHALAQPGLFVDATLRCGVGGEVISLKKGFAIVTARHSLYYIADAKNPVTCHLCIHGGTPSIETRRKMAAAKLGNQNARKHPRPVDGRQA